MEKHKKKAQENNCGKEKNIYYSMWKRYQINERIKTGYEKYMEKKENNNISNKTNGQ
jgi:hypothetical protein